MSDTTFVDFGPPAVSADWLNDLNILAYRALGSGGVVPTTAVQVLANIGAASAAAFSSFSSGLGDPATGPSLVGYSPQVAYPPTTIGSRLNEELTTSGFGTLQDAVTAAAGKRLYVIGTWTITAAVVVQPNTEIILTPGSKVLSSTVDISLFVATGASDIVIRGPGQLQMTGTGTAAYVGGVVFNACANCHVEGVRFTGMQWAGVYLNASNECSVRYCRMSDWLGVVQDASGVCILNNACDNIVEKNWLITTGEHGVLCQDPYTIGLTPKRNLIQGNNIRGQTGYGIAIYIPAQQCNFNGTIGPGTTDLHINSVTNGAIAVGQVIVTAVGVYCGTVLSGAGVAWVLDTIGTLGPVPLIAASTAATFNKVIGNQVRDIQGSYSTNRSSGSGIYGVGVGIGGLVVADNTLSNCNVQTLDRSLTPGAIGIAGVFPGVLRPTLEGNSILCGPQGDGINISTCLGGCQLSGNTIIVPASSDGSGAGGATLIGAAIRIENSSQIVLDSPAATCLGAGRSLLLYANNSPCDDISINGGVLVAAQGNALEVASSGGALTKNLSISGTRVKQIGATSYGINLTNVVGAQVDADVSSIGFEALRVLTSTQVRVSGGSYVTASAASFSTSGTCTGGFMSKAAYTGISPADIVNAGTGFIVEYLTTAQPASGTWAVGDHWVKSNPSSGAAAGGFCTAAGGPGTWKNEASIA